MAFPLDERTKRAFERPPSFSLIYFRGNVLRALPSLFDACGYRPLGNATLEEVYWSLEDVEEPSAGVVRKAAYYVPGGTVLLDPEMALGFTNETALQAFLRDAASTAVVALWERVSETAAILVFGPDGLESRTLLIRGEPEGEQVSPRPQLQADATASGLRAAMGGVGLPVEAIFGEVEAWGVELDDGSAGT